jgi:histidinol-phosphate phosphatase family protein
MRLEDVEEIHQQMQKVLSADRAEFDAIYFCPHDYSDNCNCRKPKAGMIERAEEDFSLNLPECYIIGDTQEDVIVGKSAGFKTILVLSGKIRKETETDKWPTRPDFIAKNLKEASALIGG